MGDFNEVSPGIAQDALDDFIEIAQDALQTGDQETARENFSHANVMARQLHDGAHQGFASPLERDALHSVDGARRLVAQSGAEGEALMEKWRGQFETKFALAMGALAHAGADDRRVFAEFAAIPDSELPAALERLANYAERENLQPRFFGEPPAGVRTVSGVQEEIDSIFEQHPPGSASYTSEKVQTRLRRLFAELHGDGPVVGRSFKHTHG